MLISFYLLTMLQLGQTILKKQNLQGSDVLMEAYINSLLSSPVTHMVNIAGNAGFQYTNTC